MRKIPVVFVMDFENDVLTPVVRPGCEWIFEGEGVASIKIDGTAARYYDSKLWKRFDRKLNKQSQYLFDQGRLDEVTIENFREAPAGFEPCEAQPDPVTYHWPGWVPVSPDNPADKYFIEAARHHDRFWREGATYELVGPTLAGNPYDLEHHMFIEHGGQVVEFVDRSFEGLRAYLEQNYVEGLVFTHPDGRMAKIRRKDFKFFWVKEDTRKRKRVKRP